jgi:hypothetical protein
LPSAKKFQIYRQLRSVALIFDITGEATVGEKRSNHRQPLNHGCWIVAAPGAPDILAHLSDISNSGAKLAAASPADILDEFMLRLMKDERVSRACRVVWRADNDIGISFSHTRAH